MFNKGANMKLFKRKNKDKLENSWDKYYKKDQRNITIPDISIYDYFERTTLNREYQTAINYFGVKTSFIELVRKIDICAKALVSSGVREDDVVTICLPNVPEAIIAFYAVNKIGAIASMLHPLSSEEEIKDSLIKTNSVFLFLHNQTLECVKSIIKKTKIYKTIVVSPKDSMPPLLSLGYYLTQDIKLSTEKNSEMFISWQDFITKGEKYNNNVFIRRKKESDAIILHSGGTTGTPKNIVLTTSNVHAIMEQAKIDFDDLGVEDSFLSILPMFHCFGLIVNILCPLMFGSTVILIPRFDAKRFDKLIRKYNPTILLGVPTLFEALIKNPYMKDIDMSNIKYVVSGGDTLTIEKNRLVNEFLKQHKSKARIIQGYGMTETTGPATFGAKGSDKLGSVGIPLPGNKVKILNIETKEEMNPNEIGEIFISGPTVMSRYLDNEKETSSLIQVHEDGRRWVSTGDLGYMDEDGVLFYVQRIKRMIISSGYNVYPSHIEEVLVKNKYIQEAGVIGVPHPYKVQVPVAYVVLKENIEKTPELVIEIQKYCEKNLSKYMIPKKIIFKDSLPKTLVGKINYKDLERERS